MFRVKTVMAASSGCQTCCVGTCRRVSPTCFFRKTEKSLCPRLIMSSDSHFLRDLVHLWCFGRCYRASETARIPFAWNHESTWEGKNGASPDYMRMNLVRVFFKESENKDTQWLSREKYRWCESSRKRISVFVADELGVRAALVLRYTHRDCIDAILMRRFRYNNVVGRGIEHVLGPKA